MWAEDLGVRSIYSKSRSAHPQGHNYIFMGQGFVKGLLFDELFLYMYALLYCCLCHPWSVLTLFPDCMANFTDQHCELFAHESSGFSHRKPQKCHYPNANIKYTFVLHRQHSKKHTNMLNLNEKHFHAIHLSSAFLVQIPKSLAQSRSPFMSMYHL